MSDFTLTHERSDQGYVVKIDVPDHDLAATSLADVNLDTVVEQKPNPDHDPENPDSPEAVDVQVPGPDHGKAIFTWAADPPADPKTGKPILSRKDYEEMQQREAALLVKDAIARSQPEEPKAVKVSVPASLDAVE